jgi:hypothetical protein
MGNDAVNVLHRESVFSIPKMDCPSEENLFRMTLCGSSDIRSLTFDLSNRQLVAIHRSDHEFVLKMLRPLNLGAALLASTPIAPEQAIRYETNPPDAA